MAKKKKRREICIFGYAAETRDLVDTLDKSVEIWAVNAAHVFLDPKGIKASRWLQIHPRNWESQGQPATGFWGRPEMHFEFLKKFVGPIYMSYEEPDLPQSVVYPLREMREEFRCEYFTSSFAYFMALAIHEKVDAIYLIGINLTALDEYIHQRPCLEYWIGVAAGRGIEVIIPAGSALLKGPLYGMSQGTAEEQVAKHVGDRIAHIRNEYTKACFDMNTSAAMLLEVRHWDEYLGKIFMLASKEFEDATKDLPEETKEVLTNLVKKAKDTISGQFVKRHSAHDKLRSRAQGEISSFVGSMKVEQHYLSFFGGIDHKAASLIPPMLPNPQMSTDFDVPKPQAV